MSLSPAIIHLIGHPAVGKYTVAKALVAAAADSGERVVLMDNHATGNLILSILDLEGVDPIPDEVWDRVGEVREVVYRTVADMSPPDWSFVFTNVLVADDLGRSRGGGAPREARPGERARVPPGASHV